jgi:hypothetical protein
VTDATAAINADHSYAKAYQRRAASLFAIGGIEELNSAIRDLEKVADMVDGDAHGDVQREVSVRAFFQLFFSLILQPSALLCRIMVRSASYRTCVSRSFCQHD